MQILTQGKMNHFQNSVWNSRGWTFQEHILSRRTLIFTTNQVYWVCESENWAEETILETSKPNLLVWPDQIGYSDEHYDAEPKFTFDALSTYITQYSERQFSNESDILAGFSGILRRVMYRENEIFHWGLPYTLFHKGLTCEGGYQRRTVHCAIYQVPFPSRSWMGWTAFLSGYDIDANLHKQEQEEPMADLVFYKLSIDGRVQEIETVAPSSRTANRSLQRPSVGSSRSENIKKSGKILR